MIRMIPQPIIDVRSQKVVMEEWLCRPLQGTVGEFFDVEDPYLLWEREARCIYEAIKETQSVPKLLNLTLSSLPYFLETEWTWNGGIELVEWGPGRGSLFKILPVLISGLKNRGLQVWVDDLTPADWLQWRFIKVDGYKVALDQIQHVKRDVNPFFHEMMSKNKPVVVECVETKEQERQVKRLGISYAQGFLYSNIAKIVAK